MTKLTNRPTWDWRTSKT